MENKRNRSESQQKDITQLEQIQKYQHTQTQQKDVQFEKLGNGVFQIILNFLSVEDIFKTMPQLSKSYKAKIEMVEQSQCRFLIESITGLKVQTEKNQSQCISILDNNIQFQKFIQENEEKVNYKIFLIDLLNHIQNLYQKQLNIYGYKTNVGSQDHNSFYNVRNAFNSNYFPYCSYDYTYENKNAFIQGCLVKQRDEISLNLINNASENNNPVIDSFFSMFLYKRNFENSYQHGQFTSRFYKGLQGGLEDSLEEQNYYSDYNENSDDEDNENEGGFSESLESDSQSQQQQVQDQKQDLQSVSQQSNNQDLDQQEQKTQSDIIQNEEDDSSELQRQQRLADCIYQYNKPLHFNYFTLPIDLKNQNNNNQEEGQQEEQSQQQLFEIPEQEARHQHILNQNSVAIVTKIKINREGNITRPLKTFMVFSSLYEFENTEQIIQEFKELENLERVEEKFTSLKLGYKVYDQESQRFKYILCQKQQQKQQINLVGWFQFQDEEFKEKSIIIPAEKVFPARYFYAMVINCDILSNNEDHNVDMKSLTFSGFRIPYNY